MRMFGRIAIGVIAGLVVLALAYQWRNREKVNSDGARQEAQLQEAETAQCRVRLAVFYKAWSDYRADHKGGEPPTIAALYPKYLSSGDLLLCPTAKRWLDRKIQLSQGPVKLNGRDYPMSYGFLWLTAGNARIAKRLGDRAPLVICQAHQEGLYWAAYKKIPQIGVFSEEKIGSLIPEVRAAGTLAVRRNGKVDMLDPATE